MSTRVRPPRRLVASVLVATVLLAAVSQVVAAKGGAGNIDGKFGDRGKTLTAFSAPPPSGPITMDSGGPETFVLALAQQPSGKLIAMGFHNEFGNQYYALARYTDGVIDGSFGTGGRVLLDSSTGNPTGMVIQSSGKIVVVGSIDTSTSGCQADFLLTRLTVDGAPDASFGAGSQVATDFGDCDAAEGVALGAGDSLVVAGSTAGGGDVAVSKYDANGTPDANFGSGGKTTAPGLGSGLDVVVQSTGRIVVAASTGGDWGLVGFTPTGVLDTTFGTAGSTYHRFGDNDSGTLADISLRANDRIVAAGGNHDFDVDAFNIAVAAYTANGIPDASFSGDGLAQTHISGAFGEDQAGGVAVQPDGSIVIAGWTCDANCDFVVARYLTTGVLDKGFGHGGIVTTDFASGSGDLARPILVQADGKLVAGGQSDALPEGSAFALARYKG